MNGTRELTIDELDIVSGGATVDGYTYCPGVGGLYPEGTGCKSSFWQAVSDAAVGALKPK